MINCSPLPVTCKSVHCSSGQCRECTLSNSLLRLASMHITCFIFSSLNLSSISWILDSGVTYHIVCSSSFFTFNVFVINTKVRLPNRDCVLVTHIGSVQLTNSLLLTRVLCIPSFDFNLIPINQLTRSNDYCLPTISGFCLIQDLSSWKMIGLCEARKGLYYFVQSIKHSFISPKNTTIYNVNFNFNKSTDLHL